MTPEDTISRMILSLGLQLGLTVLQEHLDDLTEVPLEFTEIVSLGVSSRPARNVAHKHAGLWVALDDELERSQRKYLRFLS